MQLSIHNLIIANYEARRIAEESMHVCGASRIPTDAGHRRSAVVSLRHARGDLGKAAENVGIMLRMVREKAGGTILHTVFQKGEGPAAAIPQDIERAEAEQAVEPLGIRPGVTREKFAAAVGEKRRIGHNGTAFLPEKPIRQDQYSGEYALCHACFTAPGGKNGAFCENAAQTAARYGHTGPQMLKTVYFQGKSLDGAKKLCYNSNLCE